jgi:DNA repair protein RadC
MDDPARPAPPAPAETPHYTAHRRRLRERFARGGSAALQDYELLELLLSYAIPRRDVKPLAKQLLATFGSLPRVFAATPTELAACEGLGEYSATLLRLVRELGAACLGEQLRQGPALSSALEVVDFARLKLAGRPHEACLIIFLDVRNRVLDSEVLAEGTVDQVVVHPRRVVEGALARRAAGLIVVHNHPSGECMPSAADDQLTQALRQATAPLDIVLLDHLIVGPGSYYSFAAAGRLAGR